MMRPMNLDNPADAMLLAFKAELRRLMGHYDIEQADVAGWCMVDPSIVSHWCSRKSRACIGPDSIVMLAPKHPAFARDLLTWQAARIGLTVAEPVAASSASMLAHGAKMNREASELVGVLITGKPLAEMADEELRNADRELSDVEQTIAPIRADVNAEFARRVRPLRVAK